MLKILNAMIQDVMGLVVFLLLLFIMALPFLIVAGLGCLVIWILKAILI